MTKKPTSPALWLRGTRQNRRDVCNLLLEAASQHENDYFTTAFAQTLRGAVGALRKIAKEAGKP